MIHPGILRGDIYIMWATLAAINRPNLGLENRKMMTWGWRMTFKANPTFTQYVWCINQPTLSIGTLQVRAK